MKFFLARWVMLGAMFVVHFLPNSALAAELDDCLLNGLKGVSSDVAAQIIRQSCENKFTLKKRAHLHDAYGDTFHNSIKIVSTDFEVGSNNAMEGRATVVVENDSPVTAVLVRLTLWTDLGLLEPRCGRNEDVDQYRYLFLLKIKPGSQAKLVVDGFRKFSGTSLCGVAEVERGRESKITDVSFGSHSVMTHDEARRMSKALGVADWIYSPTSILSRQK